MQKVRLLFAAVILFHGSSAFASGGAKAPGKRGRLQPKAVIDTVVGGVVAKRTVVLRGNQRALRGKKPVDVESAAHALTRGKSLSSEPSSLPSELTLGGRLVEAGYRVTTRGRRKSAILKLVNPGAHHLKGETEVHVYAGKRVTRLAPIDIGAPDTAAAKAPAAKPEAKRAPAAKRRSPRGNLIVEILDDLGNPTGQEREARLRFYPGDPTRVVVEVNGSQAMWVEREHLQLDLDRARGNASEHVTVNGLAGEVFAFSVDDVAELINRD